MRLGGCFKILKYKPKILGLKLWGFGLKDFFHITFNLNVCIRIQKLRL